MTQDLEKLKEWIGQKESDVDYVTVPAVHRLAATLDRDDPFPKTGDPLRRVTLPEGAPPGLVFGTILDGKPVAGTVLAQPLRIVLF